MNELYCRSLLLPHHRLPPPPLLPLEAWNMMPQHRENLSFTRPALFWSECATQRHQLTFIKDRATNACFIILLESFESKAVNPHQNCETSQFQKQPSETQEPESKNPIACHPGLAYFFQSVLTDWRFHRLPLPPSCSVGPCLLRWWKLTALKSSRPVTRRRWKDKARWERQGT